MRLVVITVIVSFTALFVAGYVLGPDRAWRPSITR
jgi:hypothetical protein